MWNQGFTRATGICVALLMTSIAGISCTESGSHSSDVVATGTPIDSATHGTVAILMTDAPTDEFDEINVTVSQVELLSEGGHVTLFSDEATFDLLRLETFSELFSVTEDVPPGDYSKIRLTLVKLELVLPGGEAHYPMLPAGGTIDLVPKTTFSVKPGETLVVEIDIDANRSIHTIQTGNGRYLFRPVVFVNVASEAPSKLVRLLGYVPTRPNTQDQTFEVCRVVEDDNGIPLVYFETCATVALAADGSVFSPDGFPGDFSDLGPEQYVMTVGTVNTDAEVMMQAAVVEQLGWSWPGEYATFKGTIDSTPVLGEFDFSPLPNAKSMDSQVNAILQTGTRVFSAAGDPLDISSIAAGLGAEIDGVIEIRDGQPDALRSSLIVLDTGPPLAHMTGQITSFSANEYQIATDSGTECLHLTEDVDIQLITVTATGSTSSPGSVDDLQPGRDVDATGLATDPCLEAQSVVVFASN